MMKKLKISILIYAFLGVQLQAQTPNSPGQTKLVEKVIRKGNEVIIPYEKYVLSNGLTVIVHEDHSDPIVRVHVTYHVGSAREEVGKSGFAHFFEHMMFQGSDNVGDEDHFKIISEVGGTTSGNTGPDLTHYYETLPSNQLETALWLEADRMGFLLDAVTHEKFEIQRSTVKNERGQRYDNRPYGLIYQKASAALYPYGHPYSWPTIGYPEDLDRVNVVDLKNFFLRWYGPNNATLVIGGDVTTAEVVKLAEKYFGPIPRGPEVTNIKLPIPALNNDRYISYEDNVRFPMLQITYPSAPIFHTDEVPLNVLTQIIGGDKSSILYENLVKTQKAMQVMAWNVRDELGGKFHLEVVPFPTQTLSDMEEMVRDALLEFEKTGVSEDALARFKITYEKDHIDILSGLAGKTRKLAVYQAYTGNPNYLPIDMKRYHAVTSADVMRVYNKYIKGKHAVILSVVPKGKSDAVTKPDNYTVDASGYTAPKDQYSGLRYQKAKDNFDRTIRPAAGAIPVVNVPAYWTDKTANGIRIIGGKNDGVPTITMLLSIRGGHKLEAKNPAKAGISSLTAAMLNEASENYSAEEISSQLEKIGSDISFSSSTDGINIQVQSLTKNLDATLALLEERMFQPRFDQADFERLKKQTLGWIADQSTKAPVVALNVFNKLLYGEGHIMAIPNSGTIASVGSITLEDVKNFYNDNFSSAVADIVIVGDIEQKVIMPKLTFLNKWQAKPVQIPAHAKPASIDKTKIYLVNKDKAAQSEIRIGYLALPYDATGEYYRVSLMNYILGGASFNNRINLNLREDKGYTYGARSGFSGTESAGPFSASASVRTNVSDSSVVEFMKEIKRYKEQGITDEELAFLKSAFGQSDALKYEMAFQKAAFLNNIIRYNLEEGFVKKQKEILQNITKNEINALAAKHLPVDKMNIVIVGDKAAIKPGLEKLGYEVIEVDSEGNML